MIYRQLPNGESQLFQYDTENQLVLAEIKKNTGESQTWEYAYDPFGRRLSKERTDKSALTATVPKQTHFVWDGSRLLQEYNYRGSYSYIYTDQDSYEPLAQIFDNAKDGKQYLSYFHNDQIGIPREMTDQFGNLLWYGEYTAWGRLKTDERVYQHAHQPFRLQNQYYDEETGLHYNFFRYYEPNCGRFVNQDPIGLLGGDNLYIFGPQSLDFIDPLGLKIYGHKKGSGHFKKKPGPKPKKSKHGNSLDSGRATTLYKIEDKEGNFLKWGITSEKNPQNRYSKKERSGKNLIPLVHHEKSEKARFHMASLERELTSRFGGDDNQEKWSKSIEVKPGETPDTVIDEFLKKLNSKKCKDLREKQND